MVERQNNILKIKIITLSYETAYSFRSHREGFLGVEFKLSMGYTSGQEKFKDPILSVTCECCAITQLKSKTKHAVNPEKN